MSDGRDPAIKLFGREIPLQEEQTPMEEGDAAYSAPETEPPSEEEKDTCQGKSNTKVTESILGAPVETPKAAEEAQPEQDHSGEDKLLKKPDKVLPCPRCNSMDTKFCYYNNYNVNQPRHFCKNCQRYWTAGGSMRNVPVGAGRRKNKHIASAHRHAPIITPDAFPSVQVDRPDSIDPFNCNATILQFGTDAPLCESMNLTSQLDFTSETSCSSSACKPEENGFPESTQQDSVSNGDGVSPLPHFQYFPGPPWWVNFAPVEENGSITQMPFCHPPLPFPFIPPPFWGWACAPLLHLPCSGNVSPTLGKHSREEEEEEEEKTERSLWIPKTLRVDDPDEAAKSSIFATLGIKPYEVSKFKAFSSKSGGGNGEASNATTTQVLHANPAALSRSRSFREITS